MGILSGQDSNNKLIPLLLDASGRVILAGTDAGAVVRPVLVDNTGKLLVSSVLTGSLPAGTNNIGDVDVLSMPNVNANLLAGTNNIGDVDVLSMPVTEVKSINSNRIFSYEAVYMEVKFNTSLAAGSNYLYGSTVPANYIWILKNIMFFYLGTVTGVQLIASVSDGANIYDFIRVPTVTNAVGYGGQYELVIPASYYIQLLVYGATLNDDAYLYLHGYKMRIS